MASGNGVRTDAFAQNAANNNMATSAASTVNPILSQLATSPNGYTPAQKAAMLSANQQALGGGLAGATGDAQLLGARLNNGASPFAAIDDATRAAGAQEAQGALGVETQDANLAQKRQQLGIEGLMDQYKTAGGLAVGDLGAANNASSSFWKQFLLQGLQSAGQVGAAAAGG